MQRILGLPVITRIIEKINDVYENNGAPPIAEVKLRRFFVQQTSLGIKGLCHTTSRGLESSQREFVVGSRGGLSSNFIEAFEARTIPMMLKGELSFGSQDVYETMIGLMRMRSFRKVPVFVDDDGFIVISGKDRPPRQPSLRPRARVARFGVSTN